jgi:hypothetical protein
MVASIERGKDYIIEYSLSSENIVAGYAECREYFVLANAILYFPILCSKNRVLAYISQVNHGQPHVN